jgi:hypothetical protein
VHIDQVMRRYGYLLLAKTPSSSTPTSEPAARVLTVNRRGRATRSYPLGVVTHDPAGGACAHQLAAIAGRVVEIGLDETGDPVVVSEPHRGPVKRSRRREGEYHFNVGYQIACPTEPFTTWLSPQPNSGDLSRPHNLRVIPEDDPDFQQLYRLRNDSENFHSNLKRTLLCDRAMSLGWRRGLLDVYAFALMNNALTEARAAHAQDVDAPPVRGRAANLSRTTA